jgi:integrase/recombinase XerD
MVRKKLTIVNTKGKKITDGFKEFYRYCQIKNLSHQSLEFYENNFLKFKLWLKEDILISDIAKATMEDYILYLKSTKVADTTINTNIRGIRAVLYYWMNLGYLENFKISKIKAVKQVKDTTLNRR